MARITDDEYQKQLNDAFKKHATGRIRAKFPSIAKDASDNELLQVWHKVTIPDASSDEANSVLEKMYSDDFTPPERPKPSLLEKVGDKVSEVGAQAKEIGGSLAQGLAEFGGAVGVAKLAGGAAGQAAMAVPTAIRLAGRQAAGTSLEKTAADMPAPNPTELASRGYSAEQIHNIVKGYTDTQHSLMGDVEEMGKGGVAEAASGIANSLFLTPPMGAVNSLAKTAAGGVEKAGMGAVMQAGVEHGVTGAVLGAGYGATQTGIEAAAQAVAEGKKTDEILGAATKGILSGAWEGAKVGGILGGGFGALAGGIGSKITQSAERKALALKSTQDAQALRLQNFADDFKPQWLAERFSDLAEVATSNEELAMNIVKNVWGEAANNENGMRAASKIMDKITKFQEIRDGLNGPMRELPIKVIGPEPVPNIAQPVGAPLETPQGGIAPAPNTLPPGPVNSPEGARVPPPAQVTPVPGLEGMPTPQQIPPTMQLEGNAPQQGAGPRFQLQQPLPIEQFQPPAPFAQGAAVEPNRLPAGASPPPEMTLATPPALVAPTPGPVPVRNSGGGPEEFGNRELTAPSAPQTDPLQILIKDMDSALAAGDYKTADKIAAMIKKELGKRKAKSATKEKK